MYGFKYFIKGKIFEVCKNVENVKGLIQTHIYNTKYIMVLLLVILVVSNKG